MTNPFGCLFGLIIAIFVFLMVVLTYIIGKVRNILSQFTPKGNTQQSSRSAQSHKETGRAAAGESSKGHKKVFDDNEGEYVDFEEIK